MECTGTKIFVDAPDKRVLHRPGIEPGPPAWQASILPLNHRCFYTCLILTARYLVIKSEYTIHVYTIREQQIKVVLHWPGHLS